MPADPTIRAVQAALRDRGFNPGPGDGILGPQTTAAVRLFQAHAGVTRSNGSPLRFPGTLGPSTLRALGIGTSPDREPVATAIEPPWMAEGRRVMGKHERTHNADLKAFLRSDGATLGDPAVLPWCGDFVETCIRLALPDEPIPDNPYLARNWLKFGQACGPVVGAVAVFWRGSKRGTSGHTGFVAGLDRARGRVYTLGGNQTNTVSIVPLGTDRVLGYRWPMGYPLGDVRPPEMSGGTLSTNEA